MSHNPCSVEGCESPVRSRGFCSLHYDRWVKSGKVSPGPSGRLVSPAKGRTCTIDGCDDPVRSRSLCRSHYERSINLSDCPSCGGEKRKGSALCSACYESTFDEISTEKFCTRCEKTKPVEDFGWRKDGRGRTKLRTPCRSCTSEQALISRRKLQEENPEEYKKRREASRQKTRIKEDRDPELRTLRSLMRSARKLGVSKDHVLAAWNESGNKCQACGKEGTLEPRGRVVIDHCHTTGKFRGLICGHCNTAAGQLGDDADRARKLAAYLSRPILET